jgi:hypothetical protein
MNFRHHLDGVKVRYVSVMAGKERVGPSVSPVRGNVAMGGESKTSDRFRFRDFGRSPKDDYHSLGTKKPRPRETRSVHFGPVGYVGSWVKKRMRWRSGKTDRGVE